MINRRGTRQIKVGGVPIGGGAPISIQSMTKTDTRDIGATVRQIRKLEGLGCDIIRVAVPDMQAARAIKDIKKKINIPLVADIHFQHKLAIEAINSGADKIRLNPGNIRNEEDIARVVRLAKKKRIPIRIGLNSGSLSKSITSSPPVYAGASPTLPLRGEVRARGMVKAALDYIKLFEDLDFSDIIISLKASDVVVTVGAYKEIALRCDYPLHLGVTAAGSAESGIIKSSVGIGALLMEGIGDTIRVSLTGDPADEVRVAEEILRAADLKRGGIDIISCPTCGRCQVDLIEIVETLKKYLSIVECRGEQLFAPTNRPLKVAVMGCVVNGPGEAREADIGIAAGKNRGVLFRKGKAVRNVTEKDFINVLLKEIAAAYEMDPVINPNT